MEAGIGQFIPLILIFVIFYFLLIEKFFKFNFFSLKYFLNSINLLCNFCVTTGLLSISKSKYDPPWRSRPSFIFFEK